MLSLSIILNSARPSSIHISETKMISISLPIPGAWNLSDGILGGKGSAFGTGMEFGSACGVAAMLYPWPDYKSRQNTQWWSMQIILFSYEAWDSNILITCNPINLYSWSIPWKQIMANKMLWSINAHIRDWRYGNTGGSLLQKLYKYQSVYTVSNKSGQNMWQYFCHTFTWESFEIKGLQS